MDVLIKFLALVFFFFSANGHPKLLVSGKNQPNIIFFFVDDIDVYKRQALENMLSIMVLTPLC